PRSISRTGPEKTDPRNPVGADPGLRRPLPEEIPGLAPLGESGDPALGVPQEDEPIPRATRDEEDVARLGFQNLGGPPVPLALERAVLAADLVRDLRRQRVRSAILLAEVRRQIDGRRVGPHRQHLGSDEPPALGLLLPG